MRRSFVVVNVATDTSPDGPPICLQRPIVVQASEPSALGGSLVLMSGFRGRVGVALGKGTRAAPADRGGSGFGYAPFNGWIGRLGSRHIGRARNHRGVVSELV